MANKELDKVIKIGPNDDDYYNVNAVKADEVSNALTIKHTTFAGSTAAETVVFTGKDQCDIEIVQAAGGKFKGHIRVPNAQDTINGASNYSTAKEDYLDDAVLGYGDIKNGVLTKLLNTSVLYAWNGTTLDPTIGKAIAGISLITGTEKDLLDSQTGFATVNAADKKISAYLYICEDEPNSIFFGTSDSEEPIQLATYAAQAGEADFANALNKSRAISVNLDTSYRGVATNFDGTENIITGTTGILPVSAGGTGSTTLTNITVGAAGSLYDASAGIVTVTAKEARDNITTVENLISGSTKAANATNADNAANAADAAKLGGILPAGWQKKILSGTADPATSTDNAVKNAENGTIYIKYSN